MESKLVICEINDGIGVISINNPPVNALTAAVMAELDQTIDELANNRSLQVVIVTGAGEKAFVAGADIKQFAELDQESGRDLVRKGQIIYSKLSALKQPVIAAIHGYAMGGGCELALACDIRIASENAAISLPEVSLAVIPGYGGTQRLPRLVGTGQALSMIFTGDPLNAAEAFRIGLVDKIVPNGEVLNEAKAMAKKIKSRAPLAVQAAKRAVYEGLTGSLEEGLHIEAGLFSELCLTEDQKEGANAFFEKRKPNYQGK